MNFCSFNLYRDYINSLTPSKASELFLSRIPNNYIQVQKGRLFTFSIQCEIRHLPISRPSLAVTAKKCTKKRNAGAELLFCLFKQLLFRLSRCRPYYCQECITNGLFPDLEPFPQNLGAIGRCACANVPRSQFRPQGFSIRFHGKCSGTRLKLPILRPSSWKRGCLLPWAY